MGFGKDGKGQILRETVILTAGALGTQDVVKGTSGVVLQTTPFRILKTEYFFTQQGAFAGEGDEIILGIANGALTTVQIAACIVSDGPDDINDPDSEEAMRAVWLVGPQLKETQFAADTYSEPMPNNGMPMSFSLRWTFAPTEGWDWFLFNPLGGALTAGAIFQVTAKHFGVWVT